MGGVAICGLNGAGKSTVGKALADALGYRFLDVEDYYFPAADVPFSVQRSKEEIFDLLRKDVESGGFVFASVSPRYGIDDLIDAVIWLDVPKDLRIRRIRSRHLDRYGERVLLGGDMYDNCENFIKICEQRDPVERKEIAKSLGKPFLELDGTMPIDKNIRIILNYLSKIC